MFKNPDLKQTIRSQLGKYTSIEKTSLPSLNQGKFNFHIVNDIPKISAKSVYIYEL